MTAKPILAVGSIALDTIETPQGQRREILGGSATFFAVAASLFVPVRLVGVVGTAKRARSTERSAELTPKPHDEA